jgi:CubicO group peptidase (beta-lactamase class C family)
MCLTKRPPEGVDFFLVFEGHRPPGDHLTNRGWILTRRGECQCVAFFSTNSDATEDSPLAAAIEAVRVKYQVPAIGGAILTDEGLEEVNVVGVRKAGKSIPATSDDLWHLGSNTKAMTAFLIGSLVAEGKLRWDDPLSNFFPYAVARAPASMGAVTLDQVLRHESGLIENLDWNALAKTGDPLNEQRQAAAEEAIAIPAYPPGTFHYSNTGYILLGAIAEKLTGQSWEELMRERVFQPLGMDSAGFGGTGTVGQIDQPWPHHSTGMAALMNGSRTDNRPVMGPCGTVHCSMGDWAKFLVDQLRGGTGKKAFFPSALYQAIQNPLLESPRGYGWLISDRGWAGGRALTHAGSNGLNYSLCWLAPARQFGVLVCCNQGGEAVAKASDEVVTILIRHHQSKL